MMRFSDRISFKLARMTVIIALTVGLVLSLGQAYFDYKSEDQALQTRMNNLLQVSSDSATHVVEVIDPRLAQKVTEGFLASEFIADARIIDETGRVLASAHNTEILTARGSSMFIEDLEEFSIDLVLPEGVSDKAGKLQLTVNRGMALKPFYDRLATDLIWGFVRSLMLATLLYFAFHRGITKPLGDVVDAVSKIDPDRPGEQRISVPESHRHDELGKLVLQVNQSLDAVQILLDNLRSTNRALTSSEEALRRRSWELEQEVDRTKKTSIELISTKEQAEAANRAKSVFLANVSHELRTPLNAIIGFSSIMSDQLFGPIGHDKYREYLLDIRSSSEHLSAILGEVLDLAKIEAGEIKLQEEVIDLVRLCEESVALIQGQATTKGFAITCQIDEATPHLFGDRLRVKQAVLNLLSNAVKFTPEHGDNVRLALAPSLHGGVCIRVMDKGIGIEEAEQSLVFSPFIRSSSALSRSHEGTGLGLSLVKAFLEKHDGWIDLSSTVGRGSCFCLNFPSARIVNPENNGVAGMENDVHSI